MNSTDMEFVVTNIVTAPGSFQPHSGAGAGEIVRRALDDVKEDWVKVMEQMRSLLQRNASVGTDGEFCADEVTFALAFSGKGKLGFLAEAGAQASVTVKFKRKAPAP